jgi:hypothetical protein
MWFEKVMAKFGYVKVKPRGKPGRKPRDPNAVKTATVKRPRANKKHQIPPQPTPAPGQSATAVPSATVVLPGAWPFPNSGS